MTFRRTVGFAAAMMLFAIASVVAQDRDKPASREIVGQIPDAVFIAAQEMRVTADVADDVLAAVGRLTVSGSKFEDLVAAAGQIGVSTTQAEDLILVGGTIDLESVSGDDLFAAGGTVDLAIDLRDDAIIAGGRVRTRAANRIGGTARIAGGDIVLEGRFAKDLIVAGGVVRLDGEVGGNVNIRAGRITLGPAARIGGSLRYRAETDAEIATGAIVTGGIERIPSAGRGRDIDAFDIADIVAGLITLVIALLAGLGLLVAVLLAVMPGVILDASEHLGERPWENLGIGMAFAFLTLPTCFLLMFTVIGLPVAIFIGLVYLALAAPTFTLLAYRIGTWVRGRFTDAPDAPASWTMRVLWSLAGLVIVVVACFVPFIGWALVLLGLAASFGALVRQLREAVS